jgi:DNA-binding transcriptional MocR family regulator
VSEPVRRPIRANEPTNRLIPSERFAARTAGMTASEIRALFAVASRPEVVSLAGGMPNLAALPLPALAEEVADLVARDGQVALQYGSAQGTPELREQICEVMAVEGIRADPNDVVVTVGSQMALDLVTRIYCDPGTWWSPRARPTSGRWAASPPTRPGWCTWRWTSTGWCRRCCGRP